MAKPHSIFRPAHCGTFPVIPVAVASLLFVAHGATAGAHQASPIARVRSENPVLTAVITRGTEHSTTFRLLVEAIGATDGLVYVLEGECGQGLRACLHMSVELSGPYRLLRVVVNPRRAPGCELVASIGHELQHALEALRNPGIRTGWGLYAFFRQVGPGPRRFETPEALAAGSAVAKEACN